MGLSSSLVVHFGYEQLYKVMFKHAHTPAHCIYCKVMLTLHRIDWYVCRPQSVLPHADLLDPAAIELTGCH